MNNIGGEKVIGIARGIFLKNVYRTTRGVIKVPTVISEFNVHISGIGVAFDMKFDIRGISSST